MPDHLPFVQFKELIQAAIGADLLGAARRRVLFGRIDWLRIALAEDPTPKTQLMLDLQALNARPRQKDGSLPLVTWLENAALQAAGSPEEDVFTRYIDILEPGMPASQAPPDVAELPEYKEAIVHQNDMVPFWYLQAGLEAGHSVARLTVPRYNNGVSAKKAYSGTGWMLSKSLLVTNHHVLNARDRGQGVASDEDFQTQGLKTEIEFDVDGDDRVPYTSTPAALEASEAKLDFAILRIDGGPAPLKLVAEPFKIVDKSFPPLNIIQHPYGRAKKIAIRNNLATSSKGSTVRYFTDTDSGSSGAPVFNDEWEVVALHRGSMNVNKINFQGKTTGVVNVGTDIHAILDWLKKESPAIYQEILLQKAAGV